MEKITFQLRTKIFSFLKLETVPILHSIVKRIVIFHFVLFAWIFFRANNLSDAIYVIRNLFSSLTINLSELTLGLSGIHELYIAIYSIIFIILVHIYLEFTETYKKTLRYNAILRWSFYIALIWVIVLFGVYDGNANFIYFQF